MSHNVNDSQFRNMPFNAIQQLLFLKGQWDRFSDPKLVTADFKVIPLKLFYYFFWNLAWLTFMIWTLKKCNKKMGSPCLCTRQRALKMEYFYWLRVINSNHLHTELSLGYPKDTKFYLESKASFIDKSSIASFKLFFDCLVAGILHFFGQFRG